MWLLGFFILLNVIVVLGTVYKPPPPTCGYTASDGKSTYNLERLNSPYGYVGYDGTQGSIEDADYMYKFNFCENLNIDDKYKGTKSYCSKYSKAPVIQVSLSQDPMIPSEFDCVPIVDLPRGTFSDHPAGPTKGVKITYSNDRDLCKGNIPRISHFIVSCSSDADLVVTSIKETSKCVYTFEVKSKHACPIIDTPNNDMNNRNKPRNVPQNNQPRNIPQNNQPGIPSDDVFIPSSLPLEVTVVVQGHTNQIKTLASKQYAGSKRQGLNLEAFSITAPSLPGLNLEYMAHIAYIGDTEWKRAGQVLHGNGNYIQGLAIRLSGKLAKKYDVLYSAHLEGTGDTHVVKNGEFIGTRAQSRRLEGFTVWLEPKLKDEL